MSWGAEINRQVASATERELEAARATIAELQKRIGELEAEREQLTELLAIRSESGMAKDMQEIMRINNELSEALTAERSKP